MATKTQKVDGITVYSSLPAQPASGGVLLIHEWWGLDDGVKKLADGFAAQGFAAAAIDLFDGKVTADRGAAARFMGEDQPKQSVPKVGKVIDWMHSPAGMGLKKVATIGWCFGGGYAMRSAVNFSSKLAGSVIYYGLLETDPESLSKVKIPLLGIFARKDGWITLDKVREFQSACKAAGISLQVHEYDADHAFANPRNAIYDAKATEDASHHVSRFFKKVLA